MVLGRCVQRLVAVFGILSPLERGRGVLEYINITISWMIVTHPTPPSFRALNSPHLARIDI